MTRIQHLSSCIVAAGLALAVGTAVAQSGGSTGTSSSGASTTPMAQPGTGTRNTPKSTLPRGDRKFMEEAAASGMFEQQAAQLASTKATDPAVKDYASKLAEQHSTANNELMQLAASLGVELPPAPTRSMRNELEKMGKKSGADFDREFIRNVGVKEHEKDIKQFQKASKDVKEPQLKAWVDKQLPTLQQHLASAQNLPEAGSKAAAATKARESTMGAGRYPSGAGSTGGAPGTSGGAGGTSGGTTR